MGVHKRQNAGSVYRHAVASGNNWLPKGESRIVNLWKEHVCAPKAEITQEELCEFRQAFAIVDVDANGSLSPDELGLAMRILGQNPTEQELIEIAHQVDHDGDGTIDFPEFCQFMKRVSMESDKEILREAFRVFDNDGNGFITADELRSFVTQIGEPLTEEEVREIFAELDLDDDGQISCEEFIHLLC
ncbi:CAL-2 protein [Aphelenchoides avenae]|nr:CAL-2 protein [Aphelenchus avenae]KAH7710949.1 CAL-2 protein [Aphelenchus avenae]